MNQQQLKIWLDFCERYVYTKPQVPLFKTHNGVVQIKKYGINNRLILQRSEKMESLLIDEVNRVLNDYAKGTYNYEGLIYMMYRVVDGIPTPLYIGKSEKFGKQGDNLSQNIANIEKNKSFFCRWGDNYAYHIGDLSAVVCPDHPESKQHKKYKSWASLLFEDYPTTQPVLKDDVYFWIHAWETGSLGIFKEFGSTPLTALEYQLISVAATLFPKSLLNQEGVNRGRKMFWITWMMLNLTDPLFYLAHHKSLSN